MDFGAIFKRAGAIWWRHKPLWALGMLAALFGRSSYGFSANVSQTNNTTIDPADLERIESPLDLIALTLPDWLAANLGLWIAAGVALGLAAALVSLLVGSIAEGALVQQADAADRTGAVALGAGLRFGLGRMPTLVGIDLLLALPGLLFGGLVLLIAFAMLGSIFGALGGSADPGTILGPIFGFLICLLVLLIPTLLVGFLIGLLRPFAVRACVLEGLGVIASLRRGWQIAWGNVGYLLLTWLATLLLGLLFGVPASLALLLLLLPIGGALFSGVWSATAVAALVGILLYSLLVGVVLGGALHSFNTTLWNLVYRAFAARTV